jgi:dolichol-phosphate mannosyltransferase
VLRALARGHAVAALVGPGSRLDRLEPVIDEIELVRADITDGDALVHAAAQTSPDAAIHLAAAGAVVASGDVRPLMEANAIAPWLLANALAQSGCRRLVTAGSSSEYGTVNEAIAESRAPDPDDPYGVAKLAGGLLARVAGRELGLTTAHLRIFSLYGPGEDARRLVASVIAALLQGRPVPLSPGEQVRDFVYVDDAADAFLDAAERPALDGVTLNIGSGTQTSVREMCLLVAAQTGGEELLRFGELPYRSGERFQWRADTTHTERLLGWRAQTALPDGIAATIAAMR